MDESEVGIIGMIGYTGRPLGPVQKCPQLILTENSEQMWDDDYYNDMKHLLAIFCQIMMIMFKLWTLCQIMMIMIDYDRLCVAHVSSIYPEVSAVSQRVFRPSHLRRFAKQQIPLGPWMKRSAGSLRGCMGCPALEAGNLGWQVDDPRKRRGLRTRVYGYGSSETIGYQALNRISLYIA